MIIVGKGPFPSFLKMCVELPKITFKKTMTFLWNTKETDRNGVNEQNTHTPNREEGNFTKGLVSVSDPPVFIAHPTLLTPSFLVGNSEDPPLFGKIS